MNTMEIQFLRKRDYKFLREIGQGGLGRTVLLKDEFIDEVFLCKKYSPIYEEYKENYFINFIEEIKLLHKIYHSNIVRVFNYYLYPDNFTGYILMEFINGKNIKEYCVENPQMISNIFEQAISGFCHLEENKILHRDIRPENIMISNEGILKIIDFGFGKKINFEENFDKSISLNWRFSPPQDFDYKIYDFRTEIYFIGKLFEEILNENNIDDFKYKDLISEMIKSNLEDRISEFSKIQRRILSYENLDNEFNEQQKETYRNFAYQLTSIISKIEVDTKYINDMEKILNGLETILRNSLLEVYIQNPVSISRVFISGNYRYYKNSEFPVETLRDFIKLLKSVSIDKQKIIINNLWQRLDSVERFTLYDDGLPF